MKLHHFQFRLQFRVRSLILFLLLSALCPLPSALCLAAPDDPEAEASVPHAERLSALKPSEPESYFKLADEIADKVDDVGKRRLALRLYVLAYELDRRRGGPPTLAASAALALTEVASAERDRRWLTAIARLLDPRHAVQRWIDDERPTDPESAYFRAATALGQSRAGQGGAALKLLNDPQVHAVLERFDRAMIRMGIPGGAREVRTNAERWPSCRDCDGKRIIPRGNRGTESRLCPVCRGTPGPDLPMSGLIGQLRFESFLLQGAQRSWAAQFAVDQGAPLIDPDPDALAATLNVDPNLVLYRDGRWVSDPTLPPKPKPEKAPKSDDKKNPPKATEVQKPSVSGN